MSKNKIRLGLIGGGKGSIIGDIHRMGALRSGAFDVVAGALSSTKERADASATAAGIPLDRSYGSFLDMAEAEAARPDGIEAVAILTPNALHAPAIHAFARHGVHIICEKPMTGDLPQATSVVAAVEAANIAFIVAHSYTAFAMPRRARALIAAGALGDIRTVHVAYLQDGRVALEHGDASPATHWHLDPAKSGISGTLADVGSHAAHMASWLTGLAIEEVCADLSALGRHNLLDNDGNALLRFKGGAKGTLAASQMAIGKANGFGFYLYGTKGSLTWSVETPNELHFAQFGKAPEVLTPDDAERAEDAHWETMGFGPFAPYTSAFTRLYTEAGERINALKEGRAAKPDHAPDLMAGLNVMKFINAAVKSSANGSVWVKL
ncbi:MAG: Gfo/Idh/MocA family oxidoreductase [Parvibaculum sp.]|nr:Gfo/Idh/MocA family oxidoreductase [Parvibaculum sp.]